MVYIMEMSTDPDIVSTQLHPRWTATARHQWAAVNAGNCQIPVSADIIIVAHGNENEIGNAGAGVDVGPWRFVQLIEANIAGIVPTGRIFISACAPNGIAQFTAGVAHAAAGSWVITRLFGHTKSVSGSVPPYNPNTLDWTEIFI